MKLTPKWLATVLGLAPAVYVLGHVYFYSAQLGAGYWLGPWSKHTGSIMAVGITGVSMVALAIFSLAPLVCVTALDWRSSRSLAECDRLRFLESVALGLGQTRLWPIVHGAREMADYSVRNRTEWAAILFGLPAIASTATLIAFELPLAAAAIVGAVVGLLSLLVMSVRLRNAAFPAPWHDILFLGIAQLHATVLACYLYLSADYWLFSQLDIETRRGPLIEFGLIVLCAAFVAWLLLPSGRAAAQRRMVCVGAMVLALSILPSHAGRVITTSMTYTAGAQSQGRLVATSGSFAVQNVCPATGCTSLDNVQMIADLGETLVFWYTEPSLDGSHTLRRAAVPARLVHFDVRERHEAALSDWALFR